MSHEDLKYFFKGYFHQDWSAEYRTYKEAVRDFCDNEVDSKVKLVKQSIFDLLEKGEITENTVFEYGGYFKPEAVGLNTREWLLEIAEKM